MPPSTKSSRALLCLGLALCLAGLLWHAWSYRFLTDDAFIAFRYARNLSAGFGWVFNPGFEAVEGFSSPLWVLLLAGGERLGWELPTLALGLSLLATLVLWCGLLRLTWLALPERASELWLLLPVFLLGITRSVAVWTSGGLETRLFECLVMLAVLRLWHEARLTPVLLGRLSLAGLLLGLLAWTRPEGAMLAISMPLALCFVGERTKEQRRWCLECMAAAAALVAALFVARFLIFGEWLPNTYYAKLDGKLWWSMGAAYLAMFALEYGLLFWLPLVLVGVFSLGRRSLLLALVLGTCPPLVIYTLAIGGDHFEYRPLDLLFPYAYLLLTLGALHAWRGRRARLFVLGMLLCSAFWIWRLPSLTHSNYPREYRPGFPGLDASEAGRGFPNAEQHAPFHWPGLSRLAAWQRALLQHTSRHFVGLRQEEHRLFFERVEREAKLLSGLVEQGLLPAELHIAIDCVGVIPFYSDLRCLDRLGLTDRETAHAKALRPEISAHAKYASLGHARRMGVDLWSLHPTRLLWEAGEPWFEELLAASRAGGEQHGIAEVQPGLFLLAWLPQGLEATRARFPQLGLRSTLDRE